MLSKGRISWKVRTRPAARDPVGAPAGDVGRRRTRPGRASGASWPDSSEKSVVLPGAVGPDDAEELVVRDLEVDVVDGGEPGERLGQTLDLEQAHLRHRSRIVP